MRVFTVLSQPDDNVCCFLTISSRMADIVEDQGVKIDQIHVATEVSHERAEAGLEQVKQAATYQPTCIIS